MMDFDPDLLGGRDMIDENPSFEEVNRGLKTGLPEVLRYGCFTIVRWNDESYNNTVRVVLRVGTNRIAVEKLVGADSLSFLRWESVATERRAELIATASMFLQLVSDVEKPAVVALDDGDPSL